MLYNKEKVCDIEEFIGKLEVGMEMPVQLRKKGNGAILVEKGRIITERIIGKLKELKDQIEHIQLEDMELKEIDELLNLGRKPKETVNVRAIEKVEECLKELSKNFNISNFQNMKGNMQEIVNSIEKSTDFQHNIERRYIQQLNNESSHSVIVACFSILLAKEYNNGLKALNPKISKDSLINLEDIAVAAVLKEIGENSENLKKIPPISEIAGIEDTLKQFPAIKDVPLDRYDEKYSPVYSYLFLESIGKEIVNKNTKMMVLLSNEPETGKGCLKVPEEISKQKRPNIKGAKSIHICDIADRLMKEAIERGHSLEEVAVALLQYTVDGTVDGELGEIFMKNIQLYPINTRVILSDDRIARVIRNHYDKYDVYKPTVQIVETSEIIDLRKCTNITIKSLINKSIFPILIKNQVKSMKDRTMSTSHNIGEAR